MKNFILLCFCFITLATQSQTIALEVEPNHSTVSFAIPISGFSLVRGVFTDYSIDLNYVNGEMSQSSVKAVIQTKSINTGIPGRDDHLRTADFFDCEKYPNAVFESSKIVEWEGKYLAIGEFSMHGITKEVVMPFEIVKSEGNTIGIRIRTKLNRLDYGVGSGFSHDSMPDFLGEIIDLEIDFWTRKKKNKETNK